MYYNNNLSNKVNLTGLSHAQELDNDTQCNLSNYLSSVLTGQPIQFTGIITNVKNNGNGINKEFTLLYAFSGIRKTLSLTFRKLYCVTRTENINNMYKEIYAKDEEIDYNKIKCMISVTGIMKMLKNGKPIFVVISMAHCIPDVDRYVYSGIPVNEIVHYKAVVEKPIDCYNISSDSIYSEYDDIPEIVKEYSDYEEKYIKKINKGKYNKAMETQMSQLDNTFKYIDAKRGKLSISADKIRLILEDIAMMHTTIQSEYHDQLGVLYDCNCLYAMNEVAFAIERLIANTKTVDAKDIIILIMVYFKQFYAEYLRRLSLPNDQVFYYRKYDKTVDEILEELGFNTNNVIRTMDDITQYVFKVTHNI